MSNKNQTVTSAEINAAYKYELRRNRDEHPDGSFDSAGRWYPSDAEYPWNGSPPVRGPSRAWPNSYNKYCRSLPHVARLLNASEAVARKIVNKAKKLEGSIKHRAILAATELYAAEYFKGQRGKAAKVAELVQYVEHALNSERFIEMALTNFESALEQFRAQEAIEQVMANRGEAVGVEAAYGL